MNIFTFILCVASTIFVLLLLAQFDITELGRDKIKRALWLTGIAVMGYCLTTGLDCVVAEQYFYGFHGFKYAFLILTPFTTLFFALRLIGSSLPDKKWFTMPLSALAIADIVLYLTNPFHGLMYTYDGVAAFGAPFKWGPLFPAHAVFCYAISLVCVILLLRYTFVKGGKLSVRVAAASILLPILFNVAFSILPRSVISIDLTAVLYAVVFSIFAFSLYNDRLLGTDVKLRERYLDLILENYPADGFVVVTDEEQKIRIATKNIAKYCFKKQFDYDAAVGENYYEFLKEHVSKEFANFAKEQFDTFNENSDLKLKKRYDSTLTGHSYTALVEEYAGTKNIHGGFIVVVNDVTEINKAKLAAEAASVAKSSFLSNVSHEIRTPLNAIIGLTQLAIKEDTSDKVRSFLVNIADSGHRLLGLINDVLDISKIESGKMEINKTEFDFSNMLSKSINVITEMAREKNLTVIINKNGPLESLDRYVYADELRFSQILVNLLSNAVKFTPEGGTITINIALEGSETDSPYMTLSVCDTGIGIAPENLSKLFDSFEQADNTITRVYGGTGLGLAISKKIAELMDGTLSVTSEVGVGSQFSATAPVSLGEKITAHRNEIHTAMPALSGKRILIVEDVEINRLIASSLLEEYDCIISEAENGKIALEMAKDQSFDIILMDMQMPVMDGLTATREMRKAGIAIPIIAMTANAFREDAERCLEAGMNDHISKPINAAHFLRVLGRFLGEE
jgi:signal transduction histidine kinase/CheY-like chemotaxis protein